MFFDGTLNLGSSHAYETMDIAWSIRPSTTFLSRTQSDGASIEFEMGRAATIMGLTFGAGIVKHQTRTWQLEN